MGNRSRLFVLCDGDRSDDDLEERQNRVNLKVSGGNQPSSKQTKRKGGIC